MINLRKLLWYCYYQSSHENLLWLSGSSSGRFWSRHRSPPTSNQGNCRTALVFIFILKRKIVLFTVGARNSNVFGIWMVQFLVSVRSTEYFPTLTTSIELVRLLLYSNYLNTGHLNTGIIQIPDFLLAGIRVIRNLCNKLSRNLSK